MKLPWSRKTTPQDFWAWIVAHKREIENCRPPNEAPIHKIDQELRRTGLRCAFEFGRESADQPFEFVISADGIAEYVPDVRTLVGAAPQIDGWKVVAFRQPEMLGDGSAIVMNGVSYTPETIKVRHKYDDRNRVFHIALLIEGFNKKDEMQFVAVTNILIDKTIGELEFIRLIGHVEFHSMNVARADDLTLVEFAKLVHEKKAQLEAIGEVFQ